MKVVLFGLIGLCLGSFVNAFVWRLKKKRNWVSERSICTHCGHTLAAKDLIPVVSWLLLRGKCRYCSKKIDDTPITELAVSVLFVLSYIAWPYGFDGEGWVRLVVWLVAVVLLAAMFLYDLKWMVLPNKLTYSLFGLAFIQFAILLFFRGFDTDFLIRSFLSTVIGGGIFHLLYFLSKGKYIGGGDVKLGYAYGLLFLNPLTPWLALTVASTLGSLIAIGLLAAGKAKMGSKLPFGPMLIVGVYVIMLWGPWLWDQVSTLWY